MKSYPILKEILSKPNYGAFIAILLFWMSAWFTIPKLGIYWDEAVQRNIARLNYEYVHENNPEILQHKDRVYGVAIELPLYYAEKILHIEGSRNVYLFRHFAVFSLFCLSAFYFFKLASLAFIEKSTPWFALILFLLSPRILGHAYFNSKDIPFLSFQVFSFYALYKGLFLGRINAKWVLIFAMLSGILINIRILGLATFGLGFAALIFMIIKQKDFRKAYLLALVPLASFLILYGTWPYLWKQPFVRIIESYETMAKFPWGDTVRFFGENVSPQDYKVSEYIFGWFSVSIPLSALFAIIAGTLLLPYLWYKNKSAVLFSLIMLATSWGILCIVIYKNAVIYDDWRHLYFIWPALIWPAIYAWDSLMQTGKKIVRIALPLFAIVHIVWVGSSLISLFPYYYIYLNERVSKKENNAIKQFEGDYWGLSYYEGIKYILKTDPSAEIKIMTFTQEKEPTFFMLSEEEKKRVKNIHNVNEAHYLLTIFRYHSFESKVTPEFNELYYSVHRQGGPIMRVWRK